MSDDGEIWLTTFHCADLDPWQAEHYDAPPLRIGEGFIDAQTENRRFRVVDIWYSNDKHGHFGWGRHVFLEDVSRTDSDRLANEAPEYFRGPFDNSRVGSSPNW